MDSYCHFPYLALSRILKLFIEKKHENKVFMLFTVSV